MLSVFNFIWVSSGGIFIDHEAGRLYVWQCLSVHLSVHPSVHKTQVRYTPEIAMTCEIQSKDYVCLSVIKGDCGQHRAARGALPVVGVDVMRSTPHLRS